MANIRKPTHPGEMLEARLNQPRVSLEYLKEQEKRHRQASEKFAEAVKSGTWKRGLVKQAAGASA